MGSVQQSLDFRVDKRGGKRRGAGRKAKGMRASEEHKERPEHRKGNPVHVTLRADPSLWPMRRRGIWRAVRVALLLAGGRDDFRVCHVSIQATHLHLIVEADDKRALSRGMKGFQVSTAHWINVALRRTGTVFPDRYHVDELGTPLQVRRALAYCLNNWRKHGEDAGRRARVDPFSSGRTFGGWTDSEPFVRLAPDEELLPVWLPRTWLLREGWRKHGPISPWERPGAR